MEAAHTPRKAQTKADSETEQEQYEEYECEDHYKEPKPEELSLLGNSGNSDQVSQSLRHLSIGKQILLSMNVEILETNFQAQNLPKALPDPSIKVLFRLPQMRQRGKHFLQISPPVLSLPSSLPAVPIPLKSH